MSAGNAFRHGLRPRKVISFDENEPDFVAFLADIHASFDPADAVEEHLVERIAICAWRLRRLYRVEVEMFDASTSPSRNGSKTWSLAIFSRSARKTWRACRAMRFRSTALCIAPS
jgi:hypothetical protein